MDKYVLLHNVHTRRRCDIDVPMTLSPRDPRTLKVYRYVVVSVVGPKLTVVVICISEGGKQGWKKHHFSGTGKWFNLLMD